VALALQELLGGADRLAGFASQQEREE